VVETALSAAASNEAMEGLVVGARQRIRCAEFALARQQPRVGLSAASSAKGRPRGASASLARRIFCRGSPSRSGRREQNLARTGRHASWGVVRCDCAISTPARERDAGASEDDGESSPETIHARTGGGNLVEMLKFVVPSVGIWVANPLLSLVDTMVVGATSTVQLAALGPGTVLCDYLGFIFTGLAVATTGMVARASSQGKARELSNIVRNAVAVAIVVGLVLAIVQFLGRLVPKRECMRSSSRK